MQNLIIRNADKNDVPAINEILNNTILNTNYNLNESVRDINDAYAWLNEHIKDNYPIIIAHYNNEVVGWASLSYFRKFSGYRTTAEVSVYIKDGYKNKGIGTALLTKLEDLAVNYHMLIAVITDNNISSIALHTKCGFVKQCTLKEVALKNGEYLDVTFMTKIIN